MHGGTKGFLPCQRVFKHRQFVRSVVSFIQPIEEVPVFISVGSPKLVSSKFDRRPGFSSPFHLNEARHGIQIANATASEGFAGLLRSEAQNVATRTFRA